MTLAFGSAPSMFVPSKRFACCYRLPSMKSFLKLHKFKYVWLSLIHLAADPATQKAPYSGSLNALNIAGKTPETPGTCCSCLLRGGGILKFAPQHSIFSILTVGLDMVLWFLICYHHSASTNHIKRLWSHLFGRAHAHLLSTDLGCTW